MLKINMIVYLQCNNEILILIKIHMHRKQNHTDSNFAGGLSLKSRVISRRVLPIVAC